VYPYLIAFLATFTPAAHGATAGCVIVVNDSNAFYSATAVQVADLFLGKRTTWQNGSQVTPVDQAPETQVREEFSVAVLGRPLQAVQAYWRGKVYSEDAVPPPELGSDQAVIQYIRGHAQAIGYVSPETALPAGVHAVVIMR
jgi:ABC-type phosphate transport system substrate-binding protein